MSSSEELSPEEKLLKVIQKSKTPPAEAEAEPAAVEVAIAVPKVADIVTERAEEPAPALQIEIVPDNDADDFSEALDIKLTPRTARAAVAAKPEVEAVEPVKAAAEPVAETKSVAEALAGEAKELTLAPKPEVKKAEKPAKPAKPAKKAGKKAAPKAAAKKTGKAAEPKKAAAMIGEIDGEGAAGDYHTTDPSAIAGLTSNLKLDGIGTGIERLFSLRMINMGLGLVILGLMALAGYTLYDVINNPRLLPDPPAALVERSGGTNLSAGPDLETVLAAVGSRDIFDLQKETAVVVAAKPVANWQAYCRKHLKVVLTISGDMVMLKDAKTGLTHHVSEGGSFSLDKSMVPELPSPTAKAVGRRTVTLDVDGIEMKLGGG